MLFSAPFRVGENEKRSLVKRDKHHSYSPALKGGNGFQ